MKPLVNRSRPDTVLALAVLVLVAVLAADCLVGIAAWVHQLAGHSPVDVLLKALLESPVARGAEL